MKTIIFSTVFLWCLTGGAVDAPPTQDNPQIGAQTEQPAKSTVQTIKDEVKKQLEKLSSSTEDAMAAEIQKKFGIQVKCERSLHKEECVQGLRSLNQAMVSSKANSKACNCFNSLTVMLSPLGVWQPANEKLLEVKVPYNVEPKRMTDYLDRQIALLFETQDQEVVDVTTRIEKDISERYNLIAKSGSVAPRQYYEGLKNVYLVLNKTFGDNPSRDDIRALGYDGIIVSNDFKSLYQDNGRLWVKVDFRSNKGDMFEALIHQVRPISGVRHLTFDLPYSSMSAWTARDVREFRASRDRMIQLENWVRSKLPNTKVNCALNRAEQNYVTVDECEQGLSNLQRALMSRTDASDLVTVSKLLIVNPTFHRNNYKVDDSTLAMPYAKASYDILPLTQKK